MNIHTKLKPFMNSSIFSIYITLLLLFIVNGDNTCNILSVNDDSSTINSIFGSTKQNPFPLGCNPEGVTHNPGLIAEIWQYDYINPYYFCPDKYDGSYCQMPWRPNEQKICWDPSYSDVNYPRYGYKQRKLIAKSENVTGVLNFNYTPKKGCTPFLNSLPINYNLAQQITTTNFTMILYGYFKPKKSDFYTFHIEGDDLLYLNFGAGNAFNCCQQESQSDKFGNYQAYSLWGSKHIKADLKVYLIGESYYPIRIFFNNRDYIAKFAMSFTIGNEKTVINDFTEYLYSVDKVTQNCQNDIMFSTTCYKGLITSTYRTEYSTFCTDLYHIPKTKTIYQIKLPCSYEDIEEECKTGFYDPIKNTCYPPNAITSSMISTSSTILLSSSLNQSSMITSSESRATVDSNSPSIPTITKSLGAQLSSRFSDAVTSPLFPLLPTSVYITNDHSTVQDDEYDYSQYDSKTSSIASIEEKSEVIGEGNNSESFEDDFRLFSEDDDLTGFYTRKDNISTPLDINISKDHSSYKSLKEELILTTNENSFSWSAVTSYNVQEGFGSSIIFSNSSRVYLSTISNRNSLTEVDSLLSLTQTSDTGQQEVSNTISLSSLLETVKESSSLSEQVNMSNFQSNLEHYLSNEWTESSNMTKRLTNSFDDTINRPDVLTSSFTSINSSGRMIFGGSSSVVEILNGNASKYVLVNYSKYHSTEIAFSEICNDSCSKSRGELKVSTRKAQMNSSFISISTILFDSSSYSSTVASRHITTMYLTSQTDDKEYTSISNELNNQLTPSSAISVPIINSNVQYSKQNHYIDNETYFMNICPRNASKTICENSNPASTTSTIFVHSIADQSLCYTAKLVSSPYKLVDATTMLSVEFDDSFSSQVEFDYTITVLENPISEMETPIFSSNLFPIASTNVTMFMVDEQETSELYGDLLINNLGIDKTVASQIEINWINTTLSQSLINYSNKIGDGVPVSNESHSNIDTSLGIFLIVGFLLAILV
ncbi:some similarities with uniprot [Nakaseomyces bracarensis]|uniref:Some similarities with uniprot n=1 Tax=Nakaseomyces bracarensis TaxID=273131 RepID=A0ABR4NLP9_9SACH